MAPLYAYRIITSGTTGHYSTLETSPVRCVQVNGAAECHDSTMWHYVPSRSLNAQPKGSRTASLIVSEIKISGTTDSADIPSAASAGQWYQWAH